MAIFDFPSSPVNGQQYTANNRTWFWDAASSSWKSRSAASIWPIDNGGTGLSSITTGNAFLSSNSAGTALTYRTFSGSGININITPSNVLFTSTATGSGNGTVDYGFQYEIPYYPESGTTVTGSREFRNILGTGIAISYNTNSSSTTSGALVVLGGVGITGSVNVGESISAPTFVGNLTGTATTAQNLQIQTSNSNNSHQIIFSQNPNSSGSALSSNSLFNYNPNTQVLNVGGIALTNYSNSSNNTTGTLIVYGGIGITGNAFIGGTVTSDLFFGNFSGSAATITNIYGTLTGTATTATNLNVATGSSNQSHRVLFSPQGTGTGVAVSSGTGLTYNPSTNLLTLNGTLSATTFSGNLSATAATSTDFYGNLTGFATTARNLNVATGSSNQSHRILFSPQGTGTGVAVSSGIGFTINPSFNQVFIGGLGLSASILQSNATTITLFNSTSTTINAFGVGTAITLGASTGTFTVNNATLRANQTTASINSTTGSIVAAGGVGIGGSLYVAGTASSISGLIISSSVITSGSWAGSVITTLYGGTGINNFTKGDLLVGTGSSLTKLGIGSNNYILTADSSTATGFTWELVGNESLVNSTFTIGSASSSLGSTIALIGGAGISFLYGNSSITIYNRGGVLITSDFPAGPLQGDLLWHTEEGVLKVYYDDSIGAGQWVDANQRWGQGQYVTFPDLGAGSVYEIGYYAASGHSIQGAPNFLNNTSTNQVSVTYTTDSTSTSSGAFVVTGGVGIGGTLRAGRVVSSSGFIETVYAGGNVSAGTTIYPNWTNGSVQTYTLTGTCSLGVPINMPTGASLTLVVSQDGTGGWAMTSVPELKYAGGARTVGTDANSINVINMFYTGSTYLAALTKGYS